jgi:ankyrin repeat protein
VACGYKQTAAVKFLLEHGADVNLHTKVLNIMLIIVLYEFSNFSMKDVSGSTALICACWRGFADIARILLDHGAVVDCQSLVGRMILCVLQL